MYLKTYCHDRVSGRGGRAAVLVRSFIKHSQWPISIFVAKAVDVDVSHSEGLLQVIACYISPRSSTSEDKTDSVFQPSCSIPTIVGCDFNARYVARNCTPTNLSGLRLVDLSIRKDLTVKAPEAYTRFPDKRRRSSDILF